MPILYQDGKPYGHCPQCGKGKESVWLARGTWKIICSNCGVEYLIVLIKLHLDEKQTETA